MKYALTLNMSALLQQATTLVLIEYAIFICHTYCLILNSRNVYLLLYLFPIGPANSQ